MLHVGLETFRTPKNLVGTEGAHGPVDRRLTPVFRDRDELATGSALGPELQRALVNSQFLIVLCSPASANSPWVNREIRFFREIHGDERVLAAIIDGDPGAQVGEGHAGCFPPALLEPPKGSQTPREPVAADFRREGDGKRLAFQKLAAGILGIPLDGLTQRMAQRRQRRVAQVAAGLGGLAFAMGGLAIYAFQQEAIAEQQRAIAEKERDTAAASLEYLVSIFEIANPATENPKTITALTILERGLQQLDTTFRDQPEVQAKLLGALGEVHANLGDIRAAEDILSRSIEAPGAALRDRLGSMTILANLHYLSGRNEQAIALAERTLQELAEEAGSLPETHLLRGAALEVIANVAAYRTYDKQAGIDAMLRAIDSYAIAEEGEKALARAHAQLGTMYSYVNDHGRAIGYLAQAEAELRRHFGDNHIEVANVLQNRALVEFRAERHGEAARTMARALQSYEQILEPSHPYLARAYLLHGRILSASGEFDDCEQAMRKAVAGFEAAFGPQHEEVAITYIYLGQFQANEGFADAAFDSFDRAQMIYDAIYPAEHANHGDLLVYRSTAIKAAGDLATARATCAEGLRIMQMTIRDDDSWLEENNIICQSI